MPRHEYRQIMLKDTRDAVVDLDSRVAVLEDLEARPSRWATQSSLEAFVHRANARLTTLEAHLGYGAPNIDNPLFDLRNRVRHLEQTEDRRQQPWAASKQRVLKRLDGSFEALDDLRRGAIVQLFYEARTGSRADPTPPPVDPRIGHLCWVWDVERLAARIQRVTEVDFHRDFPFADSYGVRWKHAELVRPEEL